MKKKDKKIFTSREQAFTNLLKKERSKTYKEQAKQQLERLRSGTPSSALLSQQIQRQQALKRQRAMGIMSGRAEALELQMLDMNEIPLLHQMESERMRQTAPPDKFIERVERSVTDSFPS